MRHSKRVSTVLCCNLALNSLGLGISVCLHRQQSLLFGTFALCVVSVSGRCCLTFTYRANLPHVYHT